MHRLQPNRTIPHPLKPTRLSSRRSCALPSLALSPELVLGGAGELLGEEIGVAESRAGGAKERTWRHLALCLSLFFDRDSRSTGGRVSMDGEWRGEVRSQAEVG
jgi:hypothetical protein